MSDFSYIDIQDLENEPGSAVYVINNGMVKYRAKAQIIFSQDLGQNRQRAIVVPSTWIPWNVGEAIPKTSLLTNVDFRGLVASGTLRLVRTSEARQFIEGSEEAREELERLRNELLGVDQILGSDQANIDAAQAAGLKALGKGDPQEGEGINPTIYDVFAREMEDGARLSNIRVVAPMLSKDDWLYIQAKSTHKGTLELARQHLTRK